MAAAISKFSAEQESLIDLNFSIRTSGKLLNPVKRNYSDHVHPGYRRIKKLQEEFQQNDCLPVHLKRGLRDRLLYMFTMGLCGVGLIMDFKLYYDLMNPPQVQPKLPEGEEKTHASKTEVGSNKKDMKDDHKSKR